MNDPRTMTEVRHAHSYDYCVQCSDLGGYRAADWQVGRDSYCADHAALMLAVAIAWLIARFAEQEVAA